MNGVGGTFSAFTQSAPEASSIAPRVDGAFGGLLLASVILVVGLVALNGTFLIRFRRGSSAPRPPLKLKEWKVEAGWIVATTLAFLGFFFWGAGIYLDENRAPADADEIHVVGRQWMWDIRQPNGRREFDELHVPVGRPVRLLMSSEDVIHSFYVPAFRLKQDVVPGKVVSLWFQATRPGAYHLFCAEYCGTKHSAMGGRVVAMAPEDYAAWLAAGNTGGDLAARGRRLFTQYGCAGCHTPGATVHAPPLEGLYGRMVVVENGQFVRADERYLHDSILLPHQHVAAGYPDIMPSFKGVMSEGELLEIVSYLKSIGAEAPAPELRQP